MIPFLLLLLTGGAACFLCVKALTGRGTGGNAQGQASPEEPGEAQFYQLCRAQGITDADSPDAARLLSVAKQHQISGDPETLRKQFALGKSIVEEAARVSTLKSREAALHFENSRYLALHGRTKQVQMCLDEAHRCREATRQSSAPDGQAEVWEQRAEQARHKRVEEMPPETLFGLLNPQVKQVTVSETGAVWIDVAIDGTRGGDRLNLSESIPADVDGFLTATLWVNEEKAGQAMIALPWDGSAGCDTLHGICRNPKIPAQQYRVTLEPCQLWAIER